MMFSAPIGLFAILAVVTAATIRLGPFLGILPDRRLMGILLPALAVVLLPFTPDGLPFAFLGWTAILFSLLFLLGFTDAQTHTVPDGLTLALVGGGCLHAFFNVPTWTLFGVSSLGLVAAGLSASIILPERWRDWMGGGDVLLLSGALAWLGPFVLFDLLLVTGLCLAGYGLISPWFAAKMHADVLQTSRSSTTHTPLAPSLGLGVAILWLGGPIL